MEDQVTGRELEELVDGVRAYVGCRFVGMAMDDGDLSGLVVEDTTFERCSLRLARWDDTRLTDCRFLECDLMGTNLTVLDWPQFGLSAAPAFGDCRLDYVDLHGLQLAGVVLYGCSLVDADLEGSVLSGSDLRYANLTDARFSGADLSEADLTGATGYALSPDRTRLTGTTVSLPEGAAILAALGMTVRAPEPRMTAATRLATPS